MRRRAIPQVVIALILSLAAHGLFVLYSRNYELAAPGELVEASEKMFRVEEYKPEPPKRPVLTRSEVRERAENAFQDIRDILSPNMPVVPALVAEEVLSEGNLDNGYGKGLPELGPEPGVPRLRKDEDAFEELYASAAAEVFDSHKRIGRDPVAADAIAVGGYGGADGKGGGWSVPDLDAPPPAEETVPDPVDFPIQSVDVARVTVPDLAPIDINNLGLDSIAGVGTPPGGFDEAGVPDPTGDLVPPIPGSEPDDQAGYEDALNLDPYLNIDVQTWRDASGQGFFRIEIKPNERSSELEVMPKDIVFVLDASTSIGQRLYWFQEAIEQCIYRLRPEDRFNVIGFKAQVRKFQEDLVPATAQAKLLASKFVGSLDASGRTDIYRSIAPVLHDGGRADRPFIVLLLSDGRPTVGIRDTRLIIQDITVGNERGATIFALGAGSEGKINKYLLDMLSYLNRGFVEIETSREGIEDSVLDLYRFLGNPILINIEGEFGAVPREEVFPKKIPNLYREGSVEIYGKFTDERDVYFRLEGLGPGGRRMDYVDRSGFTVDDGGPEIAREWAFRKVYSLVGDMALEGESPEKVAEIRELANRYGIQTPYQ